MTATMTYVGLKRARRSSPLATSSAAAYEVGPTGFALYRAAEAAGLPIAVVAPSKTPRAAGDRIKSDRKDAELLARLLLAGQLKPVAVPPPPFEAARHLAAPASRCAAT